MRQSIELNDLTLRELVSEYKAKFAPIREIWRPTGPRTKRAQAERVIECVFENLLDRPVEEITVEEFADEITSYKPAREEKLSSNGQASKARSYISPVLDWAAGRGKFTQVGAGRKQSLSVADVKLAHDPATTDPTILGERDRVLNQQELQQILPYLKYPAPRIGKPRTSPENDYRPIAMRYILYTAARLNEVASMKWQDVDRINEVWRKPKVKSSTGNPRGQNLPLSPAAMDILRSLPGWKNAKPTDLVFPNSEGGKLGNWNRFQIALNKETSTEGWHRHDLRRTASTLMYSLKIAAFVVDDILAHTVPIKREGVSASAGVYIKLMKMMTNQREPQEEALSILAEALEMIEQRKVT